MDADLPANAGRAPQDLFDFSHGTGVHVSVEQTTTSSSDSNSQATYGYAAIYNQEGGQVFRGHIHYAVQIPGARAPLPTAPIPLEVLVSQVQIPVPRGSSSDSRRKIQEYNS